MAVEFIQARSDELSGNRERNNERNSEGTCAWFVAKPKRFAAEVFGE